MKDANRQIPASLDPRMHVGKVHISAVHAYGGLAGPDLDEEPREQPERRADHEERAHG